ncbi:flavin reductase family protein [Hymenobacter psychrotolerans]|uniref:NADH-FMN oxidoreductase RutF, flavin reductase (DIM6/NTAB) family n=1 Tax=Hymenobacter psychrotolerans DSM 18569 TaxID=1121959 RepID=A0A1M6WWB7_9BACT|nr:flavin reductase [Hymenobacter psychrotolerans]SHK97944.1 NADH-FMN oxidoreductase RutF, flavin reductase (DIM6/NTAB) family [Hymenobacter psychrotolerans DSM 18569]
MRHITPADLQRFEKVFRLNLVNSLPGYKPANLIGTADGSGATNLAIFSSVLHLGSAPAVLGIVTRPTTVPRHTYQNLKATGCFTINHVHAGFVAQAHYTSADFPDTESEFVACGLTPVWRDDFPAPYVAESQISIGLRLQEELPIHNGTVLLVGSVEHIYLPDTVLLADGTLDLAAVEDVSVSGLDTYFRAQPVGAFAYARPGQGPQPKQ